MLILLLLLCGFSLIQWTEWFLTSHKRYVSDYIWHNQTICILYFTHLISKIAWQERLIFVLWKCVQIVLDRFVCTAFWILKQKEIYNWFCRLPKPTMTYYTYHSFQNVTQTILTAGWGYFMHTRGYSFSLECTWPGRPVTSKFQCSTILNTSVWIFTTWC